MRIVIRRDTSTNWNNVGAQVTLLSGEQGYETDTGKMKIGDGVSVWNDLPYYTGGITDIDHDTIIMDAAGVISLNEDSVIGDLGAAVNVKEYVDAKDDALASSITTEAAARETADNALSDRIDTLTSASEAGDTALAAQLADSIEAVNDQRGASDSALQLQISSNLSAINANTAAIADVDNKVTLLDQQSVAGDAAIVAQLQDSVTVLEDKLAEKADLDSVASVLRDVDSYVGNYQGGATISDDLVTLANYNTVQDTALDTLIAGNTAFTGSITAPGFNGDLAGNAATATLAAEASDAESGGALDTRIAALETSTALQDSVTALEAADAAQDGRLDALEADSVTATELADAVAALEAADTVESAARATADDSIVGLLGDSVTALEAVDAANFTELNDSIVALRDGVAGRALTDLNDVEGIPTTDDLLIYNGAKWVPYSIESHADDAAAAAAGFDVGDLYRGGSNRLRVRMV